MYSRHVVCSSLAKEFFGLVGDWTHTLFINLSQIISFMVIQFAVVPLYLLCS